jgi:hypothetical protein
MIVGSAFDSEDAYPRWVPVMFDPALIPAPHDKAKPERTLTKESVESIKAQKASRQQ